LGSWEILRGHYLGVAYDSLAANLLKGTAEVDIEAIQMERYEVDGKIFMYFGPFPALLRLVLNFVAPGYYGSWSRLSTLLAVFLSAVAFGRLISSALMLNQSVSSRARAWLTLTAPFALTLGTPLAFLVSMPNIFHEAMAWGLCGTLWTLLATLNLSIHPETRAHNMRIFAISFGVCLLSRLTTAIPAALLMPFVFIRYVRLETLEGRAPLRVARKLSVPCSLILISCVFQLWYNYARFGSVYAFRDLTKYFFPKTHLGSDFSLFRLPDALINYFGLSDRYFVSLPPFVRMATTLYQRPELFVQVWREQVISLSLSACWLIIPGLVGALYSLWRPCQSLARAALAATLFQALLVMMYFFVCQRYAAELVPFFVVGLCVFLSVFRLHRAWLTTLAVTSAFSILVSVTSAIRFNMVSNAPISPTLYERLNWLFFPQIAAAIADSKATFVTDLVPLPDSSSPAQTSPDRDLFGRPLQLLGYSPVKGLGMVAGSSISYEIPTDTAEFHAIAMLSERSAGCNETSLVFEGHDENGALVFRQPLNSNTPEPVAFSASVVGASRLTISLRHETEKSLCEIANLYAARFTPKR
jgi:hypothetical protein